MCWLETKASYLMRFRKDHVQSNTCKRAERFALQVFSIDITMDYSTNWIFMSENLFFYSMQPNVGWREHWIAVNLINRHSVVTIQMVLLTHIIIVTNPKKYLCEIAFLFVCSLMFVFVFVFALLATKHSAIAWPFFHVSLPFFAETWNSVFQQRWKKEIYFQCLNHIFLYVYWNKIDWVEKKKKTQGKPK